jgi:hypothetical protein
LPWSGPGDIRRRLAIASAWLRLAASDVPFGLLNYWIEGRWPAPNLLVYFLQVGAILPTVILAAWFLCFDPWDRKIYMQRFVLPVLEAPSDGSEEHSFVL